LEANDSIPEHDEVRTEKTTSFTSEFFPNRNTPQRFEVRFDSGGMFQWNCTSREGLSSAQMTTHPCQQWTVKITGFRKRPKWSAIDLPEGEYTWTPTVEFNQIAVLKDKTSQQTLGYWATDSSNRTEVVATLEEAEKWTVRNTFAAQAIYLRVMASRLPVMDRV
jgi:hypothetical protein